MIQAGITAGDAGVDILDSEPDALISLLSSGALTDLTNDMDQIHVGSLYKEAVTWQDHCYGMTFDNVGDTYFMVYSRDYLEEIGMDVTPTEKFMAGEWSYDDMKEYLTEMKAKLPEGVYPIGIHYYHWAQWQLQQTVSFRLTQMEISTSTRKDLLRQCLSIKELS